MKKKWGYKHTFYAACLGYVVQAVVNNLAPLLFVIFQRDLGLGRLQITSLITVNFLVQLSVDLLCAGFVDRLGYRRAAVLALALAAGGMAGLGSWPFVCGDAYTGLLLATVLCALGGGMLEVIISPIVEALPSDSKAGSMSLLHSFYCWGCVLVILLSTGYLAAFGAGAWRYLPLAWALLPLAGLVCFLKVPLRTLLAGDTPPTPLGALLKTPTFWVLLGLMLCAGASEQAMSQWASLFAETGLGVPKALGDLLGPCLFAVLMGSGRAFFGKQRAIATENAIAAGALLCVVSYLLAVFAPHPLLALLGCGLCGLAVAVFWPGVFSLAARAFPAGGTAMFAILALAGDLGCCTGPGLVGWVSDTAPAGLKAGLLAAALFPLALGALLCLWRRGKRAP